MAKLDMSHIETALWAVENAKEESIALLPRGIKTQHWIKQKTSPVPWQEVALKYWNSEDCDDGIGRILDALTILSQCQELLIGFLQEKPQTEPPNLSLPRTRRASI
jgi:hypothetical protein